MNYSFEKFESRNARLENRISITKSNSFGFPTGFCETTRIKQFKYVVLYYDKTAKAIGFNFTNDAEEKNKFSMIKSDKYGASAVASSFFKSYGIDPQKSHGRYQWGISTLDDNKKVYVIELDNPKQEEKS